MFPKSSLDIAVMQKEALDLAYVYEDVGVFDRSGKLVWSIKGESDV